MERTGERKVRAAVLGCILSVCFAMTAVFSVFAMPLRAAAYLLPDEKYVPTVVTAVFGADASTQVGFNWKTRNWCDSDVRLIEGEAEAKDFDGAGVIEVSSAAGGVKSEVDGEDAYIHSVFVDGLKPGTLYSYRVGDAELEWSGVGTFKTAGEGAFTFLHMSDPQGWEVGHYDRYGVTLKSAFEAYPDAAFVAMTGDIVNNSWADSTPVLEQWEWAFTYLSQYTMNTVFAPVSGNHDAAYMDFASRFALPVPSGADVSSGSYYSFDYAGVHVIGINTNDFIRSQDEDGNVFYKMSDAQEAFIRSDLAAAAEAEWKIVLQHKGFYTTGEHTNGGDEDIPFVRAQIAPIYEEYGVDIVLQGHDHLYVRTKPTYTDGKTHTADEPKTYEYEGRQNVLDPKGAVYLNTATASGSKAYAEVPYDGSVVHIEKSGTITTAQTMFTAYRIDKGYLTATAYIVEADGTRTVYDSWAIRKDASSQLAAMIEALPAPEAVAEENRGAVMEASLLSDALSGGQIDGSLKEKLQKCVEKLGLTPSDENKTDEPIGSGKGLYIGLAVGGAVVLAAAGIAVFLVLKNKKKSAGE